MLKSSVIRQVYTSGVGKVRKLEVGMRGGGGQGGPASPDNTKVLHKHRWAFSLMVKTAEPHIRGPRFNS